ncbi:hypothetical protein PCANC_24097 [Puccinia coronata f. sp. avenae]|uniref:Uncharacterized protein n=1 Tax=Puccinia coronata f. sp. avenae TaxID=200324 RepID=A0A2N5TM11_9BASI|nr:hypothetical protein PCANC_24097 [Puccinia coronata f. sp. avenae]
MNAKSALQLVTTEKTYPIISSCHQPPLPPPPATLWAQRTPLSHFCCPPTISSHHHSIPAARQMLPAAPSHRLLLPSRPSGGPHLAPAALWPLPAAPSHRCTLLPPSRPSRGPQLAPSTLYPPFSGPLSPVPANSSLSTQRLGPSGQPMMRCYSSSQHLQSFGQASLKSSEDSHWNDINQFLKLINSSQTIPSNHIPNRAHQMTRPAHLRYQKQIREAATKNKETHEQDAPVKHTAMTIEEEREYENNNDKDNSLSKLVKEQLELTLRELVGSVLLISEEPAPMAQPSLQAASGSQHSPHSGVPSGRSHYKSASGPADRPPSSVSRKGKGLSGSFHLLSPGLATLHGLCKEDKPLEPRQSFLPLLPILSQAIDLWLPHLHLLGNELGDMQIGDHTDQQHTSSSNLQHYNLYFKFDMLVTEKNGQW